MDLNPIPTELRLLNFRLPTSLAHKRLRKKLKLRMTTTLADLVDLSQHNDDVIEDALEDALAEYDNGDGGSETTEEETAEETEGGLLPFVSPVFTIAMIAIAGLVASLQGRKD